MEEESRMLSLKGVMTLHKEAWGRMKERLQEYLLILLPPAVILFIYSLMVPADDGSVAFFNVSLAVSIPVAVLGSALQVVAIIALIKMLEKNDTLPFMDRYKHALPFFLPYIWISILAGLATIAGFILLIIPGIIVAVWLSFALYALIIENIRGVAALKKSREYVRGRWWAVFGRFVALVVIALIGGGVSGIAIGLFGELSIIALAIAFIVNLFLTLFVAIYSYLLYKDVCAVHGKTGEVSTEAAA